MRLCNSNQLHILSDHSLSPRIDSFRGLLYFIDSDQNLTPYTLAQTPPPLLAVQKLHRNPISNFAGVTCAEGNERKIPTHYAFILSTGYHSIMPAHVLDHWRAIPGRSTVILRHCVQSHSQAHPASFPTDSEHIITCGKAGVKLIVDTPAVPMIRIHVAVSLFLIYLQDLQHGRHLLRIYSDCEPLLVSRQHIWSPSSSRGRNIHYIVRRILLDSKCAQLADRV
jgi:hypothetical protein